MNGEDPQGTPEYEVVEQNTEYVPQPVERNGWASGWCEKCHKRYTGAPMIDGVVYCPYHNKL